MELRGLKHAVITRLLVLLNVVTKTHLQKIMVVKEWLK
jgi:hypothetical protein